MKSFKLLVVSLLVCTSVGCATTSDVRIAKNEALDAAADANRKADEALATAREARRLAQEADARSARSEEMLNRGFKRAMYK
jgi:murein lipoprotein